jgi:hypothetical protein
MEMCNEVVTLEWKLTSLKKWGNYEMKKHESYDGAKILNMILCNMTMVQQS